MEDWRRGLADEDAVLVTALEAGEGRPIGPDEAAHFLDYAGAMRYVAGTRRVMYDLLVQGLLMASREGELYRFKIMPGTPEPAWSEAWET
jgi:hypothetical protein